MQIELPKGRLGVMVSGGWDSAVLWYLVSKQALAEGREVLAFTAPKPDDSVENTNAVLKTIANFLQTDIPETNVRGESGQKDPDDYWLPGRSLLEEVIENDEVDVMFIGGNKFPDRKTISTILADRKNIERWPTGEARFFAELNSLPIDVISPFADMLKDEIVKLGFDVGVGSLISPLTRSCIIYGPPCGQCYWCKERRWAFKQIGKNDRGNQ